MNFNRHIDDRDRLMNKWRVPDSPEMAAIVNEVIHQLEMYEKHFNLRKRARRANDKATFIACVESLVCDLIHRALTSENSKGRIAVSLRTSIKQSRYKAPCESRQFPVVVDLMSKPEMGWLELCEQGGWQIGMRTAVRAGARLLDRIDVWGIEPCSMTLNCDEEIVIQKTGKHDPFNVIDGRAEWLDYTESKMSRKYRREVREINEWIHKANLRYSGKRLVDITDKRMRRYFNNSTFKQGGRLFGGFWQWLKTHQVSLIDIDGWGISEVDFETMQVAIARADAGVTHNIFGDAYRITGYEDHRKGIKKIFASMLFATKPLKRWPRDTQAMFPPGISILEVTQAIRYAHPDLAKYWYNGAGFRFMFTESQILVKVLLKLKDAGVVALPKHDCVIVQQRHAMLAGRLMRETFEELTGGQVAVTVNGKKLMAVV